MQIGTYIAIFFIVWWLCLFVVLPFRVRNQVDEGAWIEGSERGAPGFVRLWPKLLVTTLLAGAVTALLLWGLSAEWLREYWS
jgi:predicted secreted protein